jgi:outer membrane receptor for ferric coprogen and ferric-rhodotorulic acid
MIRLKALENIEKNKMRVARYYNKKVMVRQFAEEDLVWKALLPIGTKYSAFGKWSPNWEGPFRVVRCTPGNSTRRGIYYCYKWKIFEEILS